ncbi:helix-turn-helix domain-containing protein [Haloarculaceae archaeon H-GB2-1]|nr:helix-turn-helix domain-containing protein [Haloarculaceae archaeon H-GB1-1]MEA5386676.1 helix-turn-helix domain-containing protein [Haloarculaceae archaeon H-GB11]MEA5408200.1 helix-turn-helix domain-containing protein [Haloarculaceae archaeon H-GB2-1]
MSTIVEASIPAEQFALRHALAELSNPEFEILRLVAHTDDSVLPFLWGSADDMDAFPEVMYDDPSTKNVEVIAELDDECLLRMEWTAHIRVILYILLEEDATILDAYAANETWTLRVLFPEHDSVSKTHDFCAEYEIDLNFDSIYELSDSLRRGKYGLTEAQYESIMAAFDRGYYEVPRETQLEAVAEDSDVSHQALSERLRRGHGTLIANTLAPRSAARNEPSIERTQ